jgi:hypothetical protein
MRDFERLMQLVLSRVHSVDHRLHAHEGEIAVQFKHRVSGRHKVGTVDLNFITALGVNETDTNAEKQ